MHPEQSLLVIYFSYILRLNRQKSVIRIFMSEIELYTKLQTASEDGAIKNHQP